MLPTGTSSRFNGHWLKREQKTATKDQQIVDSVPRQIKTNGFGSSLLSLCLPNAVTKTEKQPGKKKKIFSDSEDLLWAKQAGTCPRERGVRLGVDLLGMGNKRAQKHLKKTLKGPALIAAVRSDIFLAWKQKANS